LASGATMSLNASNTRAASIASSAFPPRSPGPHSHQHRHRRRPARSPGSRYRHPPRRPRNQRLPRLGQRRPGRQHHRFRRADHLQAHRHDRPLRRRAFAAEKQGQGHDRLALAPARDQGRREDAKYAARRKEQVGTGERNERIRTIISPKTASPITGIELTLYNLSSFVTATSTASSSRSWPTGWRSGWPP